MTEEQKVEKQEQIDIVENTSNQEPIQEQNENEINWKKFRQAREEERKQKEAAEKYAKQKEEEAEALKKAMEALVNQPKQSTYTEEDLTEDQIIDKKVQQALLLREMEWEKQRKQKEQLEFPERLKRTFSDFNEVCSSENLDYLEFHYPEVAEPYKSLPDGYDKWAGIYRALKKFIPNKNSIKDSKRAENNLNKPQSMAKSGMTQTGDHAPVILDEERRKQNWARMQKIMKNG